MIFERNSALHSCRMEELLIVDDDRELTEMLETYFASEGYAVRCAVTLREGFASLDENLPDILILDVMLPDGSGLEFCKRVRAKYAALPIVTLTARGDPMDRVLGLELGADDYLGNRSNRANCSRAPVRSCAVRAQERAQRQLW
jgi:DNA-binding response OmpR family regulator